MRKIIFIIIISCVSVCSAEDKMHDALVQDVAKQLNIYESNDSRMRAYQRKLESEYKNIDKKQLNLLIKEYRNNLIAAFLDALNKQSTQELQHLVDFYSSSEGKWYLKIRDDINKEALSNQNIIQADFDQKLKLLLSKK
jgi:hypothetical protein